MAEHSVTGDYYRRIAAARKPVFLIGTLAMAVTMVAAIMGASVDTGVLPPIVHAMIAYGAIALSMLAAIKIEIAALARIQPHCRRGQSTSRLVTHGSRVRRHLQGLPRAPAAPHRGTCGRRRRARRDPRVRSAGRRSVRQPRDRRDAAGRRRRSPCSDARRPRSATAPTGSPRSTASASSATARCCSISSPSSRIWRCRSRSRSSRRPDDVRDRAVGAGARGRSAGGVVGCAGRRARSGRARARPAGSRDCARSRGPPARAHQRRPSDVMSCRRSAPTSGRWPAAAGRRWSRRRRTKRLPGPSPPGPDPRAVDRPAEGTPPLVLTRSRLECGLKGDSAYAKSVRQLALLMSGSLVRRSLVAGGFVTIACEAAQTCATAGRRGSPACSSWSRRTARPSPARCT